MRGACALPVLILFVPLALAQQAPIELVTLEVDAFPTDVRPLQGVVSTIARARVSCALADGVAGVPVRWSIAEAPAWATVVISPSEDRLATESCDQGWLASTASITLTASDQAPAFVATPILVQASAGPVEREQTARDSVNASATYFAILDVQLAESIATIAPGGHVDFVTRLSNFGNGETRVEPTLVEASEPLVVAMPAPVTLESKQKGGNRLSEDMVFRVSAPDQDGYVNRVGTVSVRFVSAYAADDSYKGDESTASFLVTVRTGGEGSADPENALPAAWWGAPLALLVATLIAARSSAAWRRR